MELRKDSVGPLSLPGDPDGLSLGDSTGLVIDEEDPPLGSVCMRDGGLGEDGKGIRDPLDDDDVVGGLLLDPLGHGEQTGLVQSTPP